MADFPPPPPLPSKPLPKEEESMDVKEVDYGDSTVSQWVLGQLHQQMGRETLRSLVGRLSILIVYTSNAHSVFRNAAMVSKYGPSVIGPIIVCAALIGIPVFYLEMALGQFSSLDPITLFSRLAPVASGIGWAMLILTVMDSLRLMVQVSVFADIGLNAFQTFMGGEYSIPRCLSSYSHSCLDPSLLCPSSSSSSFPYSQEGSQCVHRMIAASGVVRKESLGLVGLNGAEQYVTHELTNSYGGQSNSLSFNIIGISLSLLLLHFSSRVRHLEQMAVFVLLTLFGAYHGFVLVVEKLRGGEKDELLMEPRLDPLDFYMWMECVLLVLLGLRVGHGGMITIGNLNLFKNNCVRDIAIVSFHAIIVPFIIGYTYELNWRFFVSSTFSDFSSKGSLPFLVPLISFVSALSGGYAGILSHLSAANIFGDLEIVAIICHVLFFVFGSFAILLINLRTLHDMIQGRLVLPNPSDCRILWQCLVLVHLTLFVLLNSVTNLDALQFIHSAIICGIPFIVICEIVVVLFIYGARRLFVDFSVMHKQQGRSNDRGPMAVIIILSIAVIWVVLVLPAMGALLVKELTTPNTISVEFTDSGTPVTAGHSLGVAVVPLVAMGFYKFLRAWFMCNSALASFHSDPLYGPREYKTRILVANEHRL